MCDNRTIERWHNCIHYSDLPLRVAVAMLYYVIISEATQRVVQSCVTTRNEQGITYT